MPNLGPMGRGGARRRTRRRIAGVAAVAGAASNNNQLAADPASVADQPQAGQEDYAAELEKLAQLKEQGIITEEEFEAKKKQILGL